MNNPARAVVEYFKAKGFNAYFAPANNPSFSEVYIECNILQFKRGFEELRINREGVGIRVSDGREWLVTWVGKWESPNEQIQRRFCGE